MKSKVSYDSLNVARERLEKYPKLARQLGPDYFLFDPGCYHEVRRDLKNGFFLSICDLEHLSGSLRTVTMFLMRGDPLQEDFGELGEGRLTVVVGCVSAVPVPDIHAVADAMARYAELLIREGLSDKETLFHLEQMDRMPETYWLKFRRDYPEFHYHEALQSYVAHTLWAEHLGWPFTIREKDGRTMAVCKMGGNFVLRIHGLRDICYENRAQLELWLEDENGEEYLAREDDVAKNYLYCRADRLRDYTHGLMLKEQHTTERLRQAKREGKWVPYWWN